MPHYYGVLGIATTADSTQVKAAFRKLAKTYHPDLEGGDALRFEEIRRAYATLSDPAQRAAYDARYLRTRRGLAGAAATMAATFALTVGSGMALAGWLLAA